MLPVYGYKCDDSETHTECNLMHIRESRTPHRWPNCQTLPLLAVLGAFTPICSLKHVPSFIENAQEIKCKGVSDIIVISVNDPFVMKAWEKTYPGNEHLKFLADGSMEFTKALGMELDQSDHGMGLRSTRYSLLINDLVVEVANIGEGGSFDVSEGDTILKALQQ